MRKDYVCVFVDYDNRDGVVQDYEAEIARLSGFLAADKGDIVHAKFFFGAYCFYGGVEQDHAQVARLLHIVADEGLIKAQVGRGFCYHVGEGVRLKGVVQDYAGGARLFRLAADKGHRRSQFSLAYLYDKREGVVHDYPEAARLYRLAANQGYMGAHIFLGMLLVEGMPGCLPAAPREAAEHLAQAAQQSDDEYDRSRALFLLSAHAHEREVVATCCIGCGATHMLKVCTKCHVAKFCSKECLARTWSVHHKQSCRLWASSTAND